MLAALRSFMFKSGISYLHHSQFGKHCSTVASPGSCFLVSKFNSSSSFILFVRSGLFPLTLLISCKFFLDGAKEIGQGFVCFFVFLGGGFATAVELTLSE